MKKYKLTIYTQPGAFELEVVSPAEHFEQAIAQALDEAGTVLLNLADGGMLILTAINTVAIAVHECDEEDTDKSQILLIPPGTQNCNVKNMNRR